MPVVLRFPAINFPVVAARAASGEVLMECSLTWTECVRIGAAADVDPTVVRRFARGEKVQRASRRVILDAARMLGLSSKVEDGEGSAT